MQQEQQEEQQLNFDVSNTTQFHLSDFFSGDVEICYHSLTSKCNGKCKFYHLNCPPSMSSLISTFLKNPLNSHVDKRLSVIKTRKNIIVKSLNQIFKTKKNQKVNISVCGYHITGKKCKNKHNGNCHTVNIMVNGNSIPIEYCYTIKPSIIFVLLHTDVILEKKNNAYCINSLTTEILHDDEASLRSDNTYKNAYMYFHPEQFDDDGNELDEERKDYCCSEADSDESDSDETDETDENNDGKPSVLSYLEMLSKPEQSSSKEEENAIGLIDLSKIKQISIETTNIDNYLDCNVQTDIIEYDSDQFDQDYTDTSDSSNNMFDHEHDYDFATDEHMDNYTTDDVMLGIFDDLDSKLSPSRVRADSFF
jgi:hypothetical protein